MKFLISPSSDLHGRLKVAGDKSISHRSIIFGSIANGVTRVSKLLEGEDVIATIRAFRAMGVEITGVGDGSDNGQYEVHGKGLHGLTQPENELDMGNSGTAFRLLTGLLCGQSWPSRLTGDSSLIQRPMSRIIEPLTAMGAKIHAVDGKPPLELYQCDQLSAIDYTTPMASAQVKSAILLAGLYADGKTSVSESATTRDHTERMLAGFGYAVERHGNTVAICGGGELKAMDIEIPADLSSAAFFIVAALISKNSELVLEKVGVNPSRNGIIPILKRMGGDIELINPSQVGGEPVADVVVKSSRLKGCEINGNDIALAIDEIPVISVAAACAQGITQISDAAELRVKESDRISSVVKGLVDLGIGVEEQPDGMIIHGGILGGGQVNSFGDHRIAMAFAMAGAAAQGQVEVTDCDNVATSFPNFSELANQSGINIEVI